MQLPHRPDRNPDHNRLRRPNPRPVRPRLAKLLVTLAMTHGPLLRTAITTALAAYNDATRARHVLLPAVTRDGLMNWAEIHHILTSRYTADGRYPFYWNEVRPT